MGIVGLISGKRGKLYFRFIVAIAIIAAAVYAYSALAAVPTAVPVIVNNNVSLPTNASIAMAADQRFGGVAL